MLKIYPSNETDFINNGLKILKPIKAKIRKEDNKEYFLEIEDTFENIEFYQNGNIILADNNWVKQKFRISNTKIDKNRLKIRANHLFYDTKNYVIADSYVFEKDLNYALDHLNSSTDIQSPFTTSSDITSTASFRCVRKSLFDAVFECLQIWGGHLNLDNQKIEIKQNIGKDRGVTLAYGKNIVDIKADENWNDVVTKIMPVGKNGTLLPEIWISLDENLYDIPYTKVIEITQNEIDFKNFIDQNGVPDEIGYQNALISDLRTKAEKYLNDNSLPKVNYELNAYLKNINDIGDTIYVKHPKCKIDIETHVIAVEYDCLQDKITKVEFGNFKEKLSSLLDNVNKNITVNIDKSVGDTISDFEQKLIDATNQIKNIFGGSYVIYDGNQILVVDRLPKEDAVDVMQINSNGIGFSKAGINGPFTSVWTIDGEMILQNLESIIINANLIKGGTLKLGGFENGNGTLEVYDQTNVLNSIIDKSGITVFCDNGNIIKINDENGFLSQNPQNKILFQALNDVFNMTKTKINEDLTLADKLKFLPITSSVNTGIAVILMS